MADPPDLTPAILLVEDDHSIIALLRRLIRNLAQEYEVVPCADGACALAALAGRRVALVVTDYRMPEIDGVELTRRLKAVSPRIPVLMITAYASPDVARLARDAGVDRFMGKPFTLEVLERAIGQMLAAPAA
jgi:CheY-like chemotaxis protein